MEPQERESDLGEESPGSQNEDEISECEESRGEHDDLDSCDEIRRHGLVTDHNDVLSKLRMQVRDIKVGEDLDATRHLAFPSLNGRVGGMPEGFQLPVSFPFTHPAAAFLPPMAPPPAQPPSSGSSHSSEGSASSQHTWSFEEQFKQVRQLYEISDDPLRKEFLDELFSFMQRKGTPINRLPIMAKSVLDLYELYKLVIARGGLVDVINKKLWQEIIKGLHLPSSITSAAFTLRTQYMKYLYPYECEKERLSTPAELQAAIDGNRREGRRSSYGQYEGLHQRPPHQAVHPALTLQQQQMAARISSVMGGGMALHNGVHHPTHPQPMMQPMNGGPLPGMAPAEFEARMMEYVKLLNKTPYFQEIRGSTGTPPRPDLSPPTPNSPMNPLEMTRMNLWSLYNNNQPPHVEPQKEALNLSDAPANGAKRQADREHTPPPKKVKEENTLPPVEEEENGKEEGGGYGGGATRIKIDSRGDARNGDGSLVVSMELNGITYQGVLFAQTAPPAGKRPQITS